MSEQANILAQMQNLVMNILKTGSASQEQGDKIEELEFLLFEQNAFKEIEHQEYSCQGEEIANLFFTGDHERAISKMSECEISAEDFFGFIEYNYDEEPLTEMFTAKFIEDINIALTQKF